MGDYFENLIENLHRKSMNVFDENIVADIQDFNIAFGNFQVNNKVSEIYKKYRKFYLNWNSKDGIHEGCVDFIPYEFLQQEHDLLVDIMNEVYDTEKDELKVKQDIENWYPLFRFQNGDYFCLDIRTGEVVFYEHEVYDSGVK